MPLALRCQADWSIEVRICAAPGVQMKASTLNTFIKTSACPSSNILLSFHLQALSPEIITLVRHHLAACDFCCAEMPLLAHYQRPVKGECKPPDIPINLRILAESLLVKSSTVRKASARKKSVKFGVLISGG